MATRRKIDPEELKKYIEDNPDAFGTEIAEHFKVSPDAICKAFKRLGITRKKQTTYKEQKAEEIEKYKEKIRGINELKIVYLAECGIDRYMHREYAYAPKGRQVYAKIQGRMFERLNIIATKRGNEILAPLLYKCTTDRTFFNLWFENELCPAVREDEVIVMDNASFHSKKDLAEIVERCNRKIIFLPPYSPELNPIEKFWASLKRFVRNNLHKYDFLDDCVCDYFSS